MNAIKCGGNMRQDGFYSCSIMKDSDEEYHLSKDLGPYPLKDLQSAKRSFLMSWTQAIRRNPVVQSIHEAHRIFPPTIRMINYIDYPFQDEFNPNWMPASHEISVKMENVHGPVVNGPRKKYRSIDAYCLFLRERSQRPKVAPLISATTESTTSVRFYTCDNCPYSSVLEDRAVQHLKSSRHYSCSECSYAKCDEEEHDRIVVILTPREVKSDVDFIYGWRKQDTAAVCPVCDLILPDKIMCGYHHQIHHPGHRAQCAFGYVQDVRYLSLCRNYRCSRCTHQFRSQNDFVDHWYVPGSSCPSPFMLVHPHGTSSWQIPPAHVIEVKCSTCGVRIDRVTPAFTEGHYVLPKKRKRKLTSLTSETRVENDPFEQLTRWVDSWSRLCVNHAYLHMGQSRSDDRSCLLCIRFVLVDKSQVFTVPPFANQSDKSLLQLCLSECKRLYDYLEHYRTGRKALFHQTKVALNELREIANLESSFTKVNTPASRQKFTRDLTSSSSEQRRSCPSFYML
ncbi:hypothetical protein FGIG_10539 [Fasciola gigantica]|uniref:C2H2-type domain-containing protein n=1 Tax=Fasciola gigantica TaxID=46835 RepID=A0A504YJN9_FASGI|nr:hypothetical protein FGIG_10539 [Fasciola gigantica]